MTASKPILIYDGDCKFCLYWAQYWQKLTGDRVIYQPYQAVAADYPAISRAEFQRAVQYIAPDGKIARAAEASFLTLNHAPGKQFWLTLYRKLPGFAWVSEKTYAFIAAHRSLFFFFTLLLWGRHYEPPRYQTVAWLFLRLLGLIYFSAFVSFATQALGLIGSQGILPVTELITTAKQQISGTTRYWLLPMLFWFNASNGMIQFISWGGAVLSLLLVLNILPRINLILLYLFYLSLTVAGQTFMSFQWDALLLETGVLALFLFVSTTLGIWLLRWLLFRFIFASGLVKLWSGDIAWQDFSALSYHFLTQPLPTPLAWYAHQLPAFILQFATLAALITELVMPFFIFFPRRLRFFAAYAILLMQVCILLTGNYNFFNLLAILLCLTLFDDAALCRLCPHWVLIKASKQVMPSPHKITVWFAGIFTVSTVLLSLVQFQLRFVGNAPTPLVRAYYAIAPLRVLNAYGPFAVMTRTRMEIVMEGSDDGIHWQAYAFKYKPGDLMRRPLWAIPHQPRVDWQMWFAALDRAEQTSWFLHFAQRLLQNAPAVTQLLAYNPFPDHPPQYLRAQFYEYTFTTPAERASTGAWWKRREVMLYLPEVSLTKQ